MRKIIRKIKRKIKRKKEGKKEGKKDREPKMIKDDIIIFTLGQSASSSSKKITHGALALALEKTWRTLDSLSPTYMFSSSGPFTLCVLYKRKEKRIRKEKNRIEYHT